jgi:NTP pyrophosphatase (non-canonical NTP hydrolase)
MTHPDHEARMNMLDKDYLLGAFVHDDIVYLEDNQPEPTLSYFMDNVVQWHRDRNLIDGSTDKDQVLKLMQELGELSDSVCKGKDIKDDIGDMLVVMLNITTRNGVSLSECLARAWDDIKDRKGRMVDGIFVKEADL